MKVLEWLQAWWMIMCSFFERWFFQRREKKIHRKKLLDRLRQRQSVRDSYHLRKREPLRQNEEEEEEKEEESVETISHLKDDNIGEVNSEEKEEYPGKPVGHNSHLRLRWVGWKRKRNRMMALMQLQTHPGDQGKMKKCLNWLIYAWLGFLEYGALFLDGLKHRVENFRILLVKWIIKIPLGNSLVEEARQKKKEIEEKRWDQLRILWKSAKYSKYQNKKVIVLDLDETLIHSTTRGMPGYDMKVEVFIERQACLFYVYKRPFVDYFLKRIRKWFRVVIFTASMPEYADPVLDYLDPHKKIFERRMFRNACSQFEGNFIKNLSTVEQDLSKVFIIDNSPIAYALNPDNAIPIEGWSNDPKDEALLDLLPFLDALRFTDDVRSVLSLRRFY